MKKTSITAALTLLAVLCMLSLSSCEILRNVILGERYSGKYRYTVEDGEVTIEGYHGLDEHLAIPASIKGMPVTSIATDAFVYCIRLRTVTIPDSVTEISFSAFDECKNLEQVTLGRGILSIESTAFTDCPKLSYNEYEGAFYLGNADNPHFVMMIVEKDSERLALHPDTVIIADDALNYCYSLKSIEVGAGNAHFKTVNNVLFSLDGKRLYKYPCADKAAAYSIPEGTVAIMPAAFMEAENLTEVNIPNGVVTIGYNAFLGAEYLTEITIPDSVTSIGHWAFLHCEGLERLTLGSGLETIGGQAFGSCILLTEITIPDSVTDISYSAFSDCTALETVVIGKGVTDMGQGVFRGCTALREVVFSNPTGWKVCGKLGSGMRDIDTSDPAQNAANLTGEDGGLFWYR